MRITLPWSLAAGLFLAAAVGGVGSSQTPETDAAMKRALERLETIEAQIGQVQQRQQTEQERMLEMEQTLEKSRTSLERRESVGEEARAALRQASQGHEAAMENLAQGLAREKETARTERDASRATAGLLAWEADQEGGDPGVLATLALLERRHRQRSRVAAARALRMEGERLDVEASQSRAVGSGRYYSAFEQYSLSQLREQHQALVGEIGSLQATFERQSSQLETLADQRSELESLVARLAQQAITAADTSEPNPEAVAPTAPPAVADAPASAEATAPSVPVEALDAEITEAGPRRLFWHATAVTVHAPAAGRVVFSGEFAGYRHLLIVDLGNGWHVLFGNMSDCTLRVGQPVAAGSAIGRYQAAQGERALPFWFEVRRGVQAVAPESCRLLTADWREQLFSR
jgi:TolA-binding protein